MTQPKEYFSNEYSEKQVYIIQNGLKTHLASTKKKRKNISEKYIIELSGISSLKSRIAIT